MEGFLKASDLFDFFASGKSPEAQKSPPTFFQNDAYQHASSIIKSVRVFLKGWIVVLYIA
jgi:hypothetical protein